MQNQTILSGTRYQFVKDFLTLTIYWLRLSPQVTLKVSVESVLHAQCSGTWTLLVVGPRARYRRVPSPQLPRPPCQISRSGPWPRVTTAIVTCLGVTRTRHRTQQPWLITTAPVLQCSISNVLLRSFLLRFAHLLNWQCCLAVYLFSVHFRILIGRISP